MKIMASTITQQAYEFIRGLLAEGEFKPGQRVSQVKLAKRVGCSILPVVEAMRRLESEGLLVKEQRKMSRVRELTLDESEGLYLVREGLEAVAARLAAQRISDDELRHLRELSARFEDAFRLRDISALAATDVAIHKLIAEAARYPLLAQELDRLLLIERTAGNAWGVPTANQRPLHSGHDLLIQALGDRDSDHAEFLMKKHIQSGSDEVRRAIRENR